ncbi:MAG: cupredoxin domain-containing protein [Rhodanobacteraceae bacterium]
MTGLPTLLLTLLLPVAASASAMPEYRLVIKDHAFDPTELTVPAGTKFKLMVVNRDSTPSEFESTEFNREKIVMPNSTAAVFIGPLDRGRYKFFDDFHRDTGNGVLIVH